MEDYLGQQRRRLLERRASKLKILDEGGEQSLSHSYTDITRIDFALRRIEQGQYGLCCNCGLPIDPERLWIIPEATFCGSCAMARQN